MTNTRKTKIINNGTLSATKATVVISIIWIILSSLFGACNKATEQLDANARYEELAADFYNPPDSFKPWVYWYWITDNISKEGVTQDLEAMADLGIGAALIGNIFLPDVPRGPVSILSDEWYDITRHAIREGQRLNVDIGLFNGPGWVQSGGPWIDSAEAMQYLTYSSLRLKGPQSFNGKLEKLPSAFRDIALLAYPLSDKNPMEEVPLKISASIPVANSFDMVDGDFNTGCDFPEIMMKNNPWIIDLEFARPIDARSLVLHPSPEPFFVNVELLIWSDDQFTSIRKFSVDRSNHMLTVGPAVFGPVAISFPKSNSNKFRLIFTQLNQTEVWFTDVERGGGIIEIEVSESARLENYIEKQLGKMHPLPMPGWKDYQWNEQRDYRNEELNIIPDSVKNISELLQPDGTLTWEVPDGDWMLVRFGMAPTGVTNAPVSEEAHGLDVDKMSKAGVRKHFDSYVKPLIGEIPQDDRKALKYLVVDSYETGSQNWTGGLESIFKNKYGYDPIPWLPVLTGRIVGSADLSDRFLWDLRRLVADEIGDKYIGGLQEIASENHLKLWVENYGHWGFPGEFLQYGSRSDLLAGEFWAEGELGSIECRAAASAAHIYGKKPVYAEALTAAREHYTRFPAMLRKRGDWSFAQGINHFVLHVYIQQPYQDRFPGINAWFGVEFNRQNTWFPYAKSWLDYIRRCNFLLQQGEYQADVCYFIGEGAPLMTGIQEPPLPSGYSFDFINADVILNRITVENGHLKLPNGISYRLMVLPPQRTMTPRLLQKILELVESGATILGVPPERSPSLAGYPDCDHEVQTMADTLWAGCDGETVKSVSFGKGLVLRGMDLGQAFNYLQIKPDLEIPSDISIEWIHYTDGQTEIYFLTNQSDIPRQFSATFRVEDKQPELWNAVSGEVRALPNYIIEEDRTTVPLIIGPDQSYFVVFSNPPDSTIGGKNFPEPKILNQLTGLWKVGFDPDLGGPEEPVKFDKLIDWTENQDPRIRNYSGPAKYYSDFNLDSIPERSRLLLSLGDVYCIAEISLNGRDLGGVWSEPWQIDISNVVRVGQNELEIDVVNTWVNRLVKDSSLPENERVTWTSINPYSPTQSLQRSGLLGPVQILHLEQ